MLLFYYTFFSGYSGTCASVASFAQQGRCWKTNGQSDLETYGRSIEMISGAEMRNLLRIPRLIRYARHPIRLSDHPL